MTAWNKTQSDTPSCKIDPVKIKTGEIYKSLNEIHMRKHHIQNAGDRSFYVITFDWSLEFQFWEQNKQ